MISRTCKQQIQPRCLAQTVKSVVSNACMLSLYFILTLPPLSCISICRDEFAEVKAVKLLRRGRRLQQVECVHSPFVMSINQSSCCTGPCMARLQERALTETGHSHIPPLPQHPFLCFIPSSSPPPSITGSSPNVRLRYLSLSFRRPSLPTVPCPGPPHHRSHHRSPRVRRPICAAQQGRPRRSR